MKPSPSLAVLLLAVPTPNAVLAASLLAGRAPAQCPQWTAGFEATDLSGYARAAVVHDDGTGRSLFVGGWFPTAGDAAASNVARWDGSRWHAVGGGTNSIVSALAVFDEGAGPKLFAAGYFTQAGGVPTASIARWDGTSWSALGSGLGGTQWEDPFTGEDLQVFDDGSGPALYVSGQFSIAGGVASRGIARWDGSSWSSLAGGVTANGGIGNVDALAVHDDGSGPQLVVGGDFDLAGTTPVSDLARWDGTTWSGFGNGLVSTEIVTLAVFDEGAGPRLFVGGSISSIEGAPGRNMARWDGSTWSPLPDMNQSPYAGINTMFVHDDGSGPALWVYGGVFLGPPTFANFARWNGTSWTPITGEPTSVFAAAAFDEGLGPRLFVVGGAANGSGGVGRWDGASWSVLHQAGGLREDVNAAAVVEEAGGTALYFASNLAMNGSADRAVARWDGTAFTYFGGLPRDPIALAAIGDGAAQRLYAGVNSWAMGNSLWRLETPLGAWTPIGGVFSGSTDTYVADMAEFDDGSGPALFVAGRFDSIGGVPLARIAKWDGSAWSPLGAGLSDAAHALEVWDDGSGPALYVAGFFQHASGVPVNRIAKWNGTSWSALGSGINTPGSRVFALEVWNDGSGSELYAGGNFTQAGGGAANLVARWNGTQWSALGSGLSGNPAAGHRVYTLHAHDDGSGSGSALYAGGDIIGPGSATSSGVARWDGQVWSAPAAGSTSGGLVRAFATYEDGSGAGPALFAGGRFDLLGGTPGENVARLSGCGSVGEVLCAGDGSGTACPCGNASPAGEDRGCTHVFGQGARLRANGVPSLARDSLVLRGDDMTPNSTCLYFQGTQAVNGGAGVAFGDGLRCASGSVVRLGVRTNVLGASTWPGAGDPQLSSYVVASGTVRVYQVWFRDASAFCTPSTFNWTNGLRVVWAD